MLSDLNLDPEYPLESLRPGHGRATLGRRSVLRFIRCFMVVPTTDGHPIKRVVFTLEEPDDKSDEQQGESWGATRSDRRSVLESRGLELGEALPHEASLAADAKRLEAADGAGRFARGAGRHGGNS